MFTVPAKVGAKEVVFKLNDMPLPDVIKWVSKIKSRSGLLDALRKEQEILDHTPILDRDDDKYIGLCDRITKIEIEVTEMVRDLTSYIVEPPKADVQRMLRGDNIGILMDVFKKFLDSAIPSEEDEKKS